MRNNNTSYLDRTKVAVSRQLKGMDVEYFDVGVFKRSDNEMLPRVFTAEQVLNAIPWLKSENMKGAEIFIRPSGDINSGLIFFDDLSNGIIKKMKEDLIAPAILIESSPLNYQGWIRVSNKAIDPELATAICKHIAKEYGGDVGSADWRHYGRLVGFTNRKPKHIQENGSQPFVLLSEYNGKQCKNAQKLIQIAIHNIVCENEEIAIRKMNRESYKPSTNIKDAYHFYMNQLSGLRVRYGTQMDNSKADWMIISKMVNLGYSDDEMRTVLENNSPAMDSRRGRESIYITTTISNARIKA